MKLNLITIYVKDLEVSLAFYRDTMNLPFLTQFEGHGNKIAMLGEGPGVHLELIEEPGKEHGGTFSVGLRTEDLDAEMARLEGKIPGFSPVIQPNPTTRFAFTKDPDGYTVQLLEQK